MKRWIKPTEEKDEFDIAWEKKFGPEQTLIFDSLEEFLQWMQEVQNFEVSSDETA